MKPLFNPVTTTAAGLQARLQSGDLTSVQIIETYLAQIDKHNRSGQKLNAVISIAPKDCLLAQAEALDRERKNGDLRGSLHGLPIVVKDCFTHGPDIGLKTTVGSYVFAREQARESAYVIKQLREQGMIIIGTANLTEFCGHRGDNMTPGYSAFGGQTRSAYDTSPPGSDIPEFYGATAGGSSAGSGVSVSAGFVPFSIGTETGGSLVFPASKAGLYAMRPTLGFVCPKGCFRISRSFDGIGAMAKTPQDLAPLIETIFSTEAKETLPKGGFRSLMKGAEGWEDIKVGFLETMWGGGDEKKRAKWEGNVVKSKYESAVETIREHGGRVLYPVHIPAAETLRYNGITSKEVAYHEFKAVIQIFCNEFENATVRNVEDIINFNLGHKDTALAEPHTTQRGLEGSRDSPLTDAQSDTAYAEIKRLTKDIIETCMEENDVEILVSGSDHSLISFTACAGYPSATVPLGNQDDGSPFGLFLLVREGREDLLFRFMSAYEATMPNIEVPKLLL